MTNLGIRFAATTSWGRWVAGTEYLVGTNTNREWEAN